MSAEGLMIERPKYIPDRTYRHIMNKVGET
jgi:hypothetical protein